MAHVLVPLAQGCEELEAITIIDLLRRAEIKVTTAGLDKEMVTASRGVRLVPDTDLDTALQQDYDMIVLPGGLPGADNLNNDPRIHSLLKQMLEKNKFIAAICAAPAVLAKAGILNGKRATSYTGILNNAVDMGIKYSEDAVVSDGKIITSRGPGTAMDFALELIEQLTGTIRRKEVELALLRSE